MSIVVIKCVFTRKGSTQRPAVTMAANQPYTYTAALTNTRNRLHTYIIYVVYTHNGVQRPYSPVVFFLSDVVSSHQTPLCTPSFQPRSLQVRTQCARTRVRVYICAHTMGHIPSTVTKSAAHVLRLKVRNPFYREYSEKRVTAND